MFGKKKDLTLQVKDTNGKWKQVGADIGVSAMEAMKGQGLDIVASCGGECACSTCHVMVDPAYLNRLNAPSDDELDMLEYAGNAESNSRLACQIILRPEDDGLRLEIVPG